MIISFPVRTWYSVIERPKFWRWTSLRLDRENYQEIIQSLQTGQTRVNNVQQFLLYLEGEDVYEEYEWDNEYLEDVYSEENNWVLNILEYLVTVVMDDDSQLKSLDLWT